MTTSEAITWEENTADMTMTGIDRQMERLSLQLLRDKQNEALIAQYQDLLRKRRTSLVRLPRIEE